MLTFDRCGQLYDAIPAFRTHIPESGDWHFLPNSAEATPCLVDTDGSRLTVYRQNDDDRPGEWVQHAEDTAGLPVAWCPRLDQLIALASAEFPACRLRLGRNLSGVGWNATECSREAESFKRKLHGIMGWGATPDEAVSDWLLALAAWSTAPQEVPDAPNA